MGRFERDTSKTAMLRPVYKKSSSWLEGTDYYIYYSGKRNKIDKYNSKEMWGIFSLQKAGKVEKGGWFTKTPRLTLAI